MPNYGPNGGLGPHGHQAPGNRVPFPRHPSNDTLRTPPPPRPPSGGGNSGPGNDPLGCFVPAMGLAAVVVTATASVVGAITAIGSVLG